MRNSSRESQTRKLWVIDRKEDLRDSSRRKKAGHTLFYQCTNRQQIDGRRWSIKTTAQSKNNKSIGKRIAEFDITTPQGIKRTTVSRPNRNRFRQVIPEKRPITNDMVSAARIQESIIRSSHRQKCSRLNEH